MRLISIASRFICGTKNYKSIYNFEFFWDPSVATNRAEEFSNSNKMHLIIGGQCQEQSPQRCYSEHFFSKFFDTLHYGGKGVNE